MPNVWQPPTVSPLCAHSVLVAPTPVSTACQCSGSPPSCLYCMHSVLVAASPPFTGYAQCPAATHCLPVVCSQCSGSPHSCLYCMHRVWQSPLLAHCMSTVGGHHSCPPLHAHGVMAITIPHLKRQLKFLCDYSLLINSWSFWKHIRPAVNSTAQEVQHQYTMQLHPVS